jgi:hypothetical protein
VSQPQRIDPDDAHLAAGLAVRRDVQAVRDATRQAPKLHPAIQETQLAFGSLRLSFLGEDSEVLYGRLMDVIVAAEDVATRIRVAYPELQLRRAAA